MTILSYKMQYRHSEHRQQKRMRLGTKSCTECRRRKVRCAIEAGSSKCQQCVLHNTTCVSQDGSASASSSSHTPSYPSPASGDVQSRLGAIEESMELLRWSLGRNSTERPSLVESHNFPRANSCEVSTFDREFDDDNDDDEDGMTDADTVLEDAPLVQYLQGSLAAQSATPPRRLPERSDVAIPRTHLMRLIPAKSTLVHVLQHTQRLWAIWPLSSSTTNIAEDAHQVPTSVPSAIEFISESLSSSNPSVVAKCLLWLSLCLLQLPKDFETSTSCRLPLGKTKLINSYVEEVDALIFQQTSSHKKCDLILLEVYVFQTELFINMGRPSRAWKSTRAGIDNSILLGLHRPGLQSSRKNEIWSAFWHQDRYLSLFLGLPYTIPEHLLPNTNKDNNDMLPEQRVLRQVAIISGHIVDRDQKVQQEQRREASYSTTVRIMEDMDRLKEMIPSGWWTYGTDFQPVPFGRSFWRRAIIVFFHFLNQLLHLPYVNMAARDKKYEYSRCLAFESSEGIIKAYLKLRALVDSTFACDFLDFVAFSAGVVLAADVTTNGSPRTANDAERVWTLINSLAQRMRITTESLQCSVAAQSAEVLGQLYTVRNGRYDGPEHYETMIPYFGRMKIKRPSNTGNRELGLPPAITMAQQAQQQVSSLIDFPQGLVEFDSSAFNFRFPTEFQTVDELGEDWIAGLDPGRICDWQGPGWS